MSKKVNLTDLADVATKGGVVGLVSYLFATWNIDPALNIVVLPLVLHVLNLLSTKIGDPQIANFFAKQSKLVAAAAKPVQAPVAKKAAKKAAPKKKK